MRERIVAIRSFVERDLDRDLRLDELRSIERLSDTDFALLSEAIENVVVMAKLV
jgi:hypothetical protein